MREHTDHHDTGGQSDEYRSGHDTSRRTFLKVAGAGTVAGSLVAGRTAAQSTPTIDVSLSSEEIDVDGSTEASISLSEAPNGLAGYTITVSVDDASVASVADAEYASAFSLTEDAEYTDDGSSVSLKGVDLSDQITAGATDVELATVTLDGLDDGETDVGVSVDMLDSDDDGSDIDATISPATLTVGEGEDDNGNGSGGDDGPTVEVDLSAAEIEADQMTEASISLSEAPDGLAGFQFDVTVDSAVATIEDASYADAFGLTEDVEIGDGSSVFLKAVDLNRNVEAGATDVDLATVIISGQAMGETEVAVDLDEMNSDADGADVEPELTSATLTVTDGPSDTTPPSAPSNLSADATTASSIDVSWDASSDEGGSGLSHYDVYVDGTLDHTVEAGTTETTLSGLDAETSYEISVAAVDGAGNQSSMVDVTATTDEAAGTPTLMVDLDESDVDPDETDSVEASLSLSSAPDGLAGYTVSVEVDDASVASVADAAYADAFGLTEDAEIADDGSSVLLKAVDLNDQIAAGATDIDLATVELSLEGEGQTDVGASIEMLDSDDDGEDIDAMVSPASLSVGEVDDEPTIEVDLTPEQIEAPQMAEAALSLSSVPDGLAGYTITVSVDNTSVASVIDAEYADAFGLTEDAEFADDGSSVMLKAVDLNDQIQAGATDVDLATVTVAGEGNGDATVDVSVEMLDSDDDGEDINAMVSPATLSVTDDPDDDLNLVLNDFEGAWPGTNALGEWSDAGAFASSGVSDGVLSVEYDDAGWFASNVRRSVAGSDTTHLHLVVRGDAGGEESDVQLEVGGQEALLADVTDDAVGTSWTDVTVDLDAMGVDRSSVDDVRLNFWQGASGALEIDEIGFDTGETTDPDDSEAPTTPSPLSADAGETSVDLSWSASTDAGGSGVSHYNVYVDGQMAESVDASATSATVSGLDAGTTYEFAVAAVDGAGNVSDQATATATTEDDTGTPTDATVVNDYDGDPAWPGQNDLGNWNGAGSFQTAEVSGEALVLDYDNGGWLVEQINQDVSDHDELIFRVRGDSGGEESDFAVEIGGVNELFADLADGSIGTGYSDLAIDLDAAGVDTSSPGELRLDFWQGGSSTIEIDEIRLE